jgi:hypothetical protein
MAIDERARHQLYLKLEEVLGPEEAGILMEHLPPVGWGDVVTKRDLDQLAAVTKRDLDQLGAATQRDLDQRLEATKQELMATFRQEFVRQTRSMVFANAASVASIAALAFAAARLT